MSGKKNLLNEAAVRRFMKLANMEALGNDFISNTVSESSCGEERQEEMMDYAREDEAPEGMDLEDAAEIEDVVDVEEMPEDDMEAPAGDLEGKVEELVSAIADAIEATTGVAVDVEGEEEMPAEEPEMDMDMEDEVEVEPEMPEMEGPEEELEETQTLDQEAIVQEVMKRVAARLLKNRSK